MIYVHTHTHTCTHTCTFTHSHFYFNYLCVCNERCMLLRVNMKVYGLDIANDKGLTNFDLNEYVQKLKIINFRGVFMRDTLPYIAYHKECGIVNLNTAEQTRGHWVRYFKEGLKRRIYFDSFGQVAPLEIQKYLKT